jgi:hypothetical protein
VRSRAFGNRGGQDGGDRGEEEAENLKEIINFFNFAISERVCPLQTRLV